MRPSKVLRLFFVFAGLTFLSDPLYAEDDATAAFLNIFNSAQSSIDPTESASNKVKLSGRQMMLSETIAKSLCFVYLGIDSDKNLIEAAQASSLFSESLDALRSGSVQKGVIREEEEDILGHLKLLDDSWRPFKNTVNSVLTTREPTKDDLEKLRVLSIEVLKHARNSSKAIEAHYGDSSLGEGVANTISVASRQRTLTQKATKEFCLILADVEPEANQQELQATRTLFFDTIFDLFFGDEGRKIIAPTNLELEILYEELFGVWFKLEEIYDQADSVNPPSNQVIEFSAELTSFLLARSEEALERY